MYWNPLCLGCASNGPFPGLRGRTLPTPAFTQFPGPRLGTWQGQGCCHLLSWDMPAYKDIDLHGHSSSMHCSSIHTPRATQ